MRLAPIVPLVLVLVLASSSSAATLHVRPDGTGSFPTIQAAVDAAAEGDTILLAPGTFTGAGNVNVDSRSKGLFVRGAGATATTIDCEWLARAFIVHDQPALVFVVSDLSITRGWGGTGGAVKCAGASVELRDMRISRSVACWGGVLGCVDGHAVLVRCELLDNTCYPNPCTGAGARVCEGLEYGGPVSALRSTLVMIGGNCERNQFPTIEAQVLYAEDSAIEVVGNRFFRNSTFDGGPVVHLQRCEATIVANEFVENGAWTSGIKVVGCTAEIRGNLFDRNRTQVGPGGVESESSSLSIRFNFFRDNESMSIDSNRSAGEIRRNVITGTIGGRCGCDYGMGMFIYGCEVLTVTNNTFYNNGVGAGSYGWATEIHWRKNSTVVDRNVIVHDELDNVVDCQDQGCMSPPTIPTVNWLWGEGTIHDSPYTCLSGFEYSDPLYRDPANDNFFLRPNSSCDMDTTVGTTHARWLYGALPKGSRPSGLLNVTKPADAWPVGAQPGTQYVLPGFSITNSYRWDASVNYRVSSPSGLLRDNGDPLSLVGATPVLAPGESFTPPPAALEVPAGNLDVVVKYSYAYAPALNIVDTVQTTIHFGNPVPVRVTSFEVQQHGVQVVLQWETPAGADADGWHVYRADANGSFRRVTPAALPASVRMYNDANIASGVTYRYRLVALDPGEMIAGEATITPSIGLTLEPNIPNPFRTETTIRFSMPQPGRATLAIYAVDGTLVRMLLDEPVNDLTRDIVWDGRDASGRPASSGVYFCRLSVDSRTLTRKLVIAR